MKGFGSVYFFVLWLIHCDVMLYRWRFRDYDIPQDARLDLRLVIPIVDRVRGDREESYVIKREKRKCDKT